MTLDVYQSKIVLENELNRMEEYFIEMLKFYTLINEDLEKISFYDYNYEFSSYEYRCTVDSSEILQDDEKIEEEFDKYFTVLESNNVIYGKIVSDIAIEQTTSNSRLLNQIVELFKKRNLVQKEYMTETSTLEIFIISDKETYQYAEIMKNSLSSSMNVEIVIKDSIIDILDRLKLKGIKSIIIYMVSDKKLLVHDQSIIKIFNEIFIVIGPDDYDLSLYCGQLEVYKYLSMKDFTSTEELKSIIMNVKDTLHNKHNNNNKIISITGISGGVGTTTAAMNIANLLAKKNPNDNVLYIDLSQTKAISNLFLSKNPLPKKSIIDLINSSEFDVEKNLENGLEKVRENFFFINGVQKHTDGDLLEKDIFLEKLLDYISEASNKFNYIIIDTGEANASILKSTIYDISNELWILTEMSLPHIAKLKTFFSLMKRAGLKDKLSFIVNRYDSVNAISVTDVMSILNTLKEDHLQLDIKLPNDYNALGHCWNFCELATDTHMNSNYVTTLQGLLENKGFIQKEEKAKTSSPLFSFLSSAK
jgi:Flp pilus assembly CpaE family ATPase